MLGKPGVPLESAMFVANQDDIREIRWHFVLDGTAILPE